MRFLFTANALRDYDKLSAHKQALVDKQIFHLLENIRYPSLRAKKYDGEENVWQARVDGGYRFYFKINGDMYVILAIVKHPK
jgi:mRNA-degrading endonuclease RelE of RelBE toxin-antitoxin system